MVKPSHHEADANADSDEEHFSDAPSSEDEGETEKKQRSDGKPKNDEAFKPSEFTWEHKNFVKGKKKKGSGKSSPFAVPVIGYDNTARDPRFANAFAQPCWTLQLLASHGHPTVAHFAKSLLEKKAFKYPGDPFEDLSVAHFMERFVYKKPKSTVSAPVPGRIPSSALNKKPVHAKTLAPDSLAYKNLKGDQVPSDERFIHRYA